MMIRYVIAIFLCLTTVLMACSKEADLPASSSVLRSQQEDSLIYDYIKRNNIDSTLRDPSTLTYRIRRKGGNESIKPTSIPTVIFTTRLLNGQVVQSSLGVPTNFDGRPMRDHIAGWQVGLQKIGKGGKIQLFIPSALAYGAAGINQLIPSYAILICDVELVDFKD
jgi:FKBP-type peptidyl-prolyl cis-trans isomerase FkpA